MAKTIEELAQRLYNEDGYQGSIYRKADLKTLRYYENKAIEIKVEEKHGKVCYPKV